MYKINNTQYYIRKNISLKLYYKTGRDRYRKFF